MKKIRTWLQGRSSRGQFWLASGLLWLAFYFFSSLVAASALAVAVWIINLPVLMLLLGLCVRRLHDVDRPAWWLLALLLPVLGAAWLLWLMACKAGVAHDNRWGAGANTAQADHLTVS